MHPVVLLFASGHVFFPAVVLASLGVLVAAYTGRRWLRLTAAVLGYSGILLALASATPQPGWLYGVWLLCLLLGSILAGDIKGSRRAQGARVAAWAGAAVGLVMLGAEWRWHRQPCIALPNRVGCYVIGDSISAGMGNAGEAPWPQVLAERSGLVVHNLARPGATVETALRQAADVAEQGVLVIVEIGGNDVLSGTPVVKFSADLRALLQRVARGGNTVAIFETPLPPLANGYGAAERRLAQEFHAAWVPKHVLTRVFGTPKGTADGLHLSAAGHRQLAEAIAGLLQP